MLAPLKQAYAEQRNADAVRIARQIGSVLVQSADGLMLAANAAIKSEALSDADTWLTQLRQHHRDDATLRRIHANVLNRLGVNASDRSGARDYLQRALTLDPSHATARFNLALEQRRAGRDDLAVPLLIELQDQDPFDEAVNLNLAECHAYSGNAAAVTELLEAQAASGFKDKARWRAVALTAQNDTFWPDLFAGEADAAHTADVAVAVVLEQIEQDRRDAAIATAQTAIDFCGGAAPIWRCELAAHLHPGNVMASSAAIDAERERFRATLAELRDQPQTHIAPSLSQLSWSNFALGYHGRDELALQSEYGDWLCATVARMRPDLAIPLPVTRHDRSRVVLASSHWRHCTAGHYFRSWIDALAACSELELIVLAIGPMFDDLTDAIAETPARLIKLEGDVDADCIAESLHALQAALILYPELGMDVRLLPVAALRLAPLQWMAWGHPVTSGLPSIDAYLSCAEMEPANASAHYRERLHLLPGIGTRYPAPPRPQPATRNELGLHLGPLVVVPQSGVKIHPANDVVYRDLLAAMPDAQLLFFRNESARVTDRLRERFARTLPPASMQRVVFHPLCAREQFLRVIGACDLMLDTLHWSGGNTALDALRMGTPILTTTGAFMRGRQTSAMLRLLGLDHSLVVAPEHLASRAAELLRSGELAGLRTEIDARFSRLLDGDAALAQLQLIVRTALDEHFKVLS